MLPKGLLKEYSRTIAMMVRMMDMATVFFAGWLAYLFRFNDVRLPSSYLGALLLAVAMTPVVFSFFNIYVSIRGAGFLRHLISLIQAMCVLGFVLAGLSFFTKSGDTFSRLWFVTWVLFTLFFLILCRCSLLLLLRFMRSRGLNERRVVILGASELGIKLAETVQQALWTGFRIVTFIDDEASNKPALIHRIPVIQTPVNLGQHLAAEGIDEIWLALPLSDEARVKEILYDLRHHTINMRFVLDIFGLDLLNHSITDLAGFPVLNISSTPMMGMNRLVKAVEDRLLAAIILVLIGPLLLLIAIGVKLSSKGPVFFKQYRHGWDGRIIKVYKFRTMIEHEEEDGKVTQATLSDNRVTAFGRFLRRTSLDELPQFINVLQGRMSIVGPRPHAVAHNEFYKDSIHTYMQRHRVKPGITGWAQVNGWRGETDTLEKMQKRVEYDLYYINNWSLSFDMKIIFLTLLRGFIGRNAY
ncbi:undecaprenyl-phosphate glucose phosphotransferase [Aquicella lusitana]|uniref:Putative colanic acid biosynthesis UDP-glucose lipid carrier transferase n=1 Tax=Aquicella lusitana TaxID=254246 RepID=A0A370GXZ3_9COXI|nr:undecaprenyl-phosphate glucose phosphotransferase [Aquicella lusitana]RDI48120.1 putative colanic acid biosynthesis UDP-glucose lipid carrier transferase [Aquicella lusitana]VVC72864.1 UDP-glucose:undecaprenyl-phosphate glucose-1-phosphate transferase [Aquicella lusitana]